MTQLRSRSHCDDESWRPCSDDKRRKLALMAKKKPTPKAASAKAEDALAQSKTTTKKQIEAYAHTDKKRANNPPVGLVNSDSEPVAPTKKTYAYDPHLDPQLMWAGKSERTSFEVPTVSLHVHERIDPKAIIAAVRTNGERAKPARGQVSPTVVVRRTSSLLTASGRARLL